MGLFATTVISCSLLFAVTRAGLMDPKIIKTGDCIGPDTRPGSCRSLIKCPELAGRLQANPDDKYLAHFLRHSNNICGQNPPIVCCPNPSSDVDISEPSNSGFPPNGIPFIKPIQTLEPRILTPEEGCGQEWVVRPRLPVDGYPSMIESWPWIALLGYDNGIGGIDFLCSGSLITKRHIVTAAHCIRKDLRTVRLGEYNVNVDNETRHVDIKIVRSVKHPEYMTRDGHSNVGILYLASDVEFTGTIRPVCVPEKGKFESESLVGYHPYVAGWKKSSAANSSNVLIESQLPILANNECKEWFQSQKLLRSEQQFDNGILCAGYLHDSRDACQFNSGAPLNLPRKLNSSFFYHDLLGVVSHGDGFPRAGIPCVFTYVPHFADWIRAKVSEFGEMSNA